MQRFFVSAAAIRNGTVHFSPEQSRQLSTVLRAQKGDEVQVFDNAGWSYDVQIDSLSAEDATGLVMGRHLAVGEPRIKITLYPALLKSDHLEYVLQKGTEIGITAFVPTISSRCVVDHLPSANRLQRWERIIVEAAEQSGRGRLPSLQPTTIFEQACEQSRGKSFVAWEGETHLHLSDALDNVSPIGDRHRPLSLNLLTGPEGGFTEEEIERAQSYGIVPVTLGPRLLRAETAAIVMATLVLYHFKDIG